MSFETITLGDILTFSNGKTSPDRVSEGQYAVYGANGTIGSTDSINTPQNTIIIGRVGSYCGAVHFSKKECWVTDNAIKANAKNNTNPYYAYHLLSYLDLNRYRAGSGQPLINQSILNSLKVPNIDVIQQNKIAYILENIDKRIDLLKKTNQILESISQSIFKSWFVDFDPVHAKQQGKECAGIDKATADLFPNSFVESELGLIPKDWVATTIGEVLDRLKTKNRYGKDNLDTYGSIPVYEQGVNILMGYRLGEPEYVASTSNPIVIFGDHTCVTKILFSPFDISSNVIAFQGKSLTTSWVYYAIKDKQHFEEYRRHWGELIVKKIVIPNAELCAYYSKTVMPFLSKIDINEKKISHLSLLRDLLLPRLISGKLDLSNIEEQLEGIA